MEKPRTVLKGQVFAAVSMMLIAAIALGVSTFAWFIGNSITEVQKMQLTVETSTSLLAAVGKVDAASYTPYKALIQNTDIIGKNDGEAGWEKMLSNELFPASVTSENLKAAQPSFFASLGKPTDGAKLDTFSLLGFGTEKNEVGQGYVKRIPLQFISSNALDVYFGADDVNSIADLILDAVGKDIGGVTPAQQADFVRAALRVAIVPRNDGNYIDGAPVVFQFDGGAPVFAGSGNNTDYGSVSLTGNANEALGLYDAISGVDSNGKIASIAELKAMVPGGATDADLYCAVTKTTGGVVTVTPKEGGRALFTMKGDTPRNVDIYIWLEGTDQDCISALSDFSFQLRLPFAAVVTDVNIPNPDPSP